MFDRLAGALQFQIYYQKKLFPSNSTKHREKIRSSTESLKRLFYKIAKLEILPILYMVLVNFGIHFHRL